MIFPFHSFLFYFKFQLFKLNSNSCFELQIPNIKKKIYMNYTSTVWNNIIYYLIMCILFFFFSFLFYFPYSKFSNLNLSHKFEYKCKHTRIQHGMHIYVFIYLSFDYFNSFSWICTKKKNQEIPKTLAYKYIYLFIYLFILLSSSCTNFGHYTNSDGSPQGRTLSLSWSL